MVHIWLSDVEWVGIDDLILAEHVLFALRTIRERTTVGLHEALDALRERYRLLREIRPADFFCSHEESWEGFCS